jgi:hypothetical protein
MCCGGSAKTGIMEMVVNSKAVSEVLKDHNNDIKQFFKAAHPQEGAPYGIDPKVRSHDPCVSVASFTGVCVCVSVFWCGCAGDGHVREELCRLLRHHVLAGHRRSTPGQRHAAGACFALLVLVLLLVSLLLLLLCCCRCSATGGG